MPSFISLEMCEHIFFQIYVCYWELYLTRGMCMPDSLFISHGRWRTVRWNWRGFSIVFRKSTVDHVPACQAIGPHLALGMEVGYLVYKLEILTGKEMRWASNWKKGGSPSLSRACSPWRRTEPTECPILGGKVAQRSGSSPRVRSKRWLEMTSAEGTMDRP